MKVARLHATADLRLHDETDPRPGAGEELVRVTAVGLCGSDRHWFSEGGIGDSRLTRPLVLGHEIGGVIATGPRAGERVAVDPAIPCGRCELCATGAGHLCREVLFAGHGTTDGGLRTLMAWPARLLQPLPDAIGDDMGALMEPLGVALHAADLGKVARGMRVGVFGCGPIGLLLIQVLSRLGASPIVATDPIPQRLAAALQMGAERPDTPFADMALDVVFEAAGEDAAVEDAVAAVRPGGRIVLVGIPSSDSTTFRASTARHKGLTLLLSRRMRASDLPRAIELTVRGDIDPRSLVSAPVALERAAEAFDRLVRHEGLKTIVRPS
ncbi:MAG TPA: alcohol dehydrogenase catalytic domain-containing protein [Candidatus Limnocylindrales bacterium]